MGGHAAGASTSREGPCLKPPILVRNKEDCTSLSSHAYTMPQERNTELIPCSARTSRRRRSPRFRQGGGRSPTLVGMAR